MTAEEIDAFRLHCLEANDIAEIVCRCLHDKRMKRGLSGTTFSDATVRLEIAEAEWRKRNIHRKDEQCQRLQA